MDLILETTRQHLVGFVKDEQLDAIGAERVSTNHVVHTARGSDDHVDTRLQFSHVLTDVGTSDTSMALRLHKIAKGDNYLLDLNTEGTVLETRCKTCFS